MLSWACSIFLSFINFAILSLSSGVNWLPYYRRVLISLIMLKEAKALLMVVAITFALSYTGTSLSYRLSLLRGLVSIFDFFSRYDRLIREQLSWLYLHSSFGSAQTKLFFFSQFLLMQRNWPFCPVTQFIYNFISQNIIKQIFYLV